MLPKLSTLLQCHRRCSNYQREKDGRQSRQRPRNTCGSSALPLPVHDPLRQLDQVAQLDPAEGLSPVRVGKQQVRQ